VKINGGLREAGIEIPFPQRDTRLIGAPLTVRLVRDAVMAHIADHFPLPQLGYLRVFWKGEPTLDTLRRAAAALATDDADILAMLDAARVTRTLISAR
jgi:hypothetical protein